MRRDFLASLLSLIGFLGGISNKANAVEVTTPNSVGVESINKNAKSKDLTQEKYAKIQKMFNDDKRVKELVESKMFPGNVRDEVIKPVGSAIIKTGIAGLLAYGTFKGGKAVYNFLNSSKGRNIRYKPTLEVNVDMSPIANLGKVTTSKKLVRTWLECWKAYNNSNHNRKIGHLACRDGNEEKKGSDFDSALVKDLNDSGNLKEAMEAYSNSSCLQSAIMPTVPTVPTGGVFGPMYVYLSNDNGNGKDYKSWTEMVEQDIKLYDVSSDLLVDMIDGLAEYLGGTKNDRNSEMNINKLLKKIYRFFVIYLHLDIPLKDKNITPLGFGLMNGNKLGMELSNGNNVNFNGGINVFSIDTTPLENLLKEYKLGPLLTGLSFFQDVKSGKVSLMAVKSLLSDLFNKAKANEEVSAKDLHESLNRLFKWVYHLKWLGESGGSMDILRAAYNIVRGSALTESTNDTVRGEAKKTTGMINSIFDLINPDASASDVLKVLNNLIRNKDDINKIAIYNISKMSEIFVDVGQDKVKAACNNVIAFLKGYTAEK